jgi:predicted membrane-bound dolichyl-phosphate-mannose-protein mannosyltransferase
MTKRKINEDGSITLEAALIVPVFMFFILFLIIIIQIAVAEIALQRAASQTTEYVATHVYPVHLVKNHITDKVSKNDNLAEASKIAGMAYEYFGWESHTQKLAVSSC